MGQIDEKSFRSTFLNVHLAAAAWATSRLSIRGDPGTSQLARQLSLHAAASRISILIDSLISFRLSFTIVLARFASASYRSWPICISFQIL
jgi:hypothetical protein